MPAMPRIQISTQGLEHLIKRMELLPVKVQKSIARKVLRAASTPVMQEGRRNIERVVSEDARGQLAKSMGRKFKTYPFKQMTIVLVGPRQPEGRHAHFVEFGTGPRYHASGKYVGEMPAMPYMRPAFDTTRDTVRSTIATKLGDEIEKAAKA